MDAEVKQSEQSPRVSARTPKRKTFFDEDDKPQPVAKKKLSSPVVVPVATVPKRQSIDRQTTKPKVSSGEPRKPVKKCDRSGCNASLPICFVNATERCAGNGYTSRWYHISPAEHFCNECFEYYYRSHKDGYEVFTKWKREWSSNSKCEASIRTYMVDQLLPYWLQCTLPGCGKWRQLSRHLDLTPDFVSRFTCGMSYLGVKTEKQREHCDRIEDDRATYVRTAPWFSLHMMPSFLYHSPAVEHLGGLFFPDRVGMSPSDPAIAQFVDRTKAADDTDALVQPFALTLRPIGALSFDPASMSALEEREFPGYVKDQVMYLGLRNLVLALWAKDVKSSLRAEQCVPHVICRGIARIRYIQDLQDIVRFLTRHAFINYGLLPAPASGAYLPPIYNQESVLVVGAGAAGLAAARHLSYMGTKVTVLEGRDRIGGRVWDTSTTGHGAQMIMGHVNNPLALICLQTGIELRRLEDRCDLYKECGVAVDSSTDRRMDFHFNAMLDTIAEWRKNKDKSADTSLLKKIWEMHQQFVEESQLEFTEEELRILEFHLTNLEFACGAPLDQVSCLYWDQNETFPQFAGDHIFIKGGLSQVLHKMADGLDVRLNSEVCKIDHSSESVSVTTTSGEIFKSSKVLVTVPLAVLQKDQIVFEPTLPEHKQTAIKSIGTGLVEKVVLEFKKKFWASKTKVSPVFGHLPFSGGNRGMFSVFYDLSAITKDLKESTTEESHVLMSHVTGASVELIKDESDAQVADRCLKILAELFPDEDIPEPISCVVTHWRDDKFAHMAYSYLPIGVDGSAYDILAEEVNGRVHFAGEATSREFPQSVTGAYLSGIREANKILESSAQKSLTESK